MSALPVIDANVAFSGRATTLLGAPVSHLTFQATGCPYAKSSCRPERLGRPNWRHYPPPWVKFRTRHFPHCGKVALFIRHFHYGVVAPAGYLVIAGRVKRRRLRHFRPCAGRWCLPATRIPRSEYAHSSWGTIGDLGWSVSLSVGQPALSRLPIARNRPPTISTSMPTPSFTTGSNIASKKFPMRRR